MNDTTLAAVVEELKTVLPGRRFGKIFPLSKRSLAIDLRLSDSRYLFIAAEPRAPRIFLIQRKLRELERASDDPVPFHLVLKKHLSGARVTTIEKLPDERVLFIHCSTETGSGDTLRLSLVAQLTGKSSDLYLLDNNSIILEALIHKDIEGQRPGDRYIPPQRPASATSREEPLEVAISAQDRGSISAALDRYYTVKEADERFRSHAAAKRKAIERELAKRVKLIERLNSDLKSHGDAGRWKRYGDLILANLKTAKREGSKILLTDYFDETAPEIEIESDADLSLTDTAQMFFKRYAKATNAAVEIERRIKTVKSEIDSLDQQLVETNRAIANKDESYFADKHRSPSEKKAKKQKAVWRGARGFISSDGFEILVGKKAVDNDQLTFRIANSLDLWLHAADYPGSHVVVRNPNRKDIPPSTLIESAQLAAFYSSGRSQPKAAVHYTQKKFVNKPKGAAAGLVRLASFKTILVQPIVPATVIRKEK